MYYIFVIPVTQSEIMLLFLSDMVYRVSESNDQFEYDIGTYLYLLEANNK